MKKDRKQIVAILLMVLSLLFLAGFLILFLVSAYKKEKTDVQKEVGYLFVNSIRKIEGGVLNRIVMRSDSTVMGHMRLPRMKKDSLKVKSVISIADHDMTLDESKFQIEVKHEETSRDLNQLEGSVAMFIAMDQDSIKSNDSCKVLRIAIDFLKELEDNFRKNMEAAKLPVTYTIQKVSDHSNHTNENAVTGSYTDISTGDRYIVNIDKYGFLVFKKIIAELIFSILLFFCVAFAFYIVYKTLAAEKMLLNLKNDFIQNITHELKTPIATVSVALEALHDFKGMEDLGRKEEYLDISKNELKRLSLLVDKVLNISQFEKELLVNQMDRMDLKQTIEEILNTLKLQFEKLNVEVKLHSVGTEFVIFGDKQRVDGLLYNLLDNAMKYNNKPHPFIHIELSREHSFLILAIRDNGIGIPEEHQKHVFDKFYRVPQGNVHNVKGHGLGLSFVAQVVNELGGTITLESIPEVGTTFMIKIPSASNS